MHCHTCLYEVSSIYRAGIYWLVNACVIIICCPNKPILLHFLSSRVVSERGRIASYAS